MNSSDVRHLLPRYADGELTVEQRVLVDEALASDESLRADADRWKRLRQCARRALSSESCPQGLRSRVTACLADERRRQQRGNRWRIGTGVLGLAAAIGMAFILHPEWSRSAPAGGARQLIASAATVSVDRFTHVYETCAKQSNHAQVQLEGKCPVQAQRRLAQTESFKAIVPDLRAEGFELQGICHCLTPGVHAVHAHFRQSSGSGRALSVFSVDRCLELEGRCKSPTGCGGKRTYQSAEAGGVRVLKWNEPAGTFAVCGEFAEDRLHQLAETVHVAMARYAAPPVADASAP